MSLFSDWTDDIPVKISEKYKPPPRIELERGVSESEAKAKHALETVKYEFDFENYVLEKIRDLRSTKETLRNERRHRLHLLEEAKQRRIDEIAAAQEAAERLQQLSVENVSYPNPDDIIETVAAPVEQANVLRPVRVHPPTLTNPLDSDPLDEVRRLVPRPMKIPNQNLGNLTFSDFDHDTSSPFDELELQSIDDFQQLAQVLQDNNCLQSPQQQHFDNNVCSEHISGPSGYAYYTCPVQSYNYLPRASSSRSRDVNDILSELNDGILQQIEKTKEAIALACTPPPIVQTPAAPPTKAVNNHIPNKEILADPFDLLSPKLQELCRRFHNMGFPRDRVARVVAVLGDSDKQVIDGLLIIEQLLDLGFPESRVTASLNKHNFDRDKALDELIA